jgi:hypothetical protein
VSGRPSSRLAAAVVVACCVLATGCATSDAEPSAADQVPGLEEVLHRVDTALATHRFPAARQQLKKLKADVVHARDAGDLRETDAARVLEAIGRLQALLPASTDPTQSASPSPSSSVTTGPAKPSTPKPSRPEHTASAPTSPSASTAPSASSTPSPTATSPAATPTELGTRDASPAASSSPAP